MTAAPIIVTDHTMIVEDTITVIISVVIIDTEASKDIIIINFLAMAATGNMIIIHTADIPNPTDITSQCI